MQYQIGPPPMNPLSRLLAAILTVLALLGAVFFGVFVLALVAGLGLIAWLVFSLRVWWLRKKFSHSGVAPESAGRAGQSAGPRAGERKGDDVIDAEYTVISRRDED